MQVAGTITDRRIGESSGLAASLQHPGQLWTHNDSGDQPRLYRLTGEGKVDAVVRLAIDRAQDWEDMASFRWNGKPWLLVADAGDNGAKRPFVTVWLLPEPDGGDEAEPVRAVRVDLRYAEGPRDCEAVAVDAERGEVLLLTKVDPRRTFSEQSAVYIVDLKQALKRIQEAAGQPVEPLEISRAATLPLKIVTAADVSPDGLRCVALTYGDAWEFARQPGEAWPDAFGRMPRQINLGPRGQSEAVAYGPDGQTLYLTTEGVGKPLWKVSPQ